MANWHFGKSRNWYLNFGPYVGFLTSASVNNINLSTGTSDKEIDLKGSCNSTDAGLALGIGMKFKVGDKARFFVEEDGQGGLAGVFKNASPNGDILNTRIAVNVGLMF
jgi:hypothetical protein